MKTISKSALTKQIEDSLKKIKPFSNRKFFGATYVGGGASRLDYLNIKIPQVRLAFSSFDLSQKKFSEIENLWFKSNIFEVKTLALIWLEQQTTEFLLINIHTILNWAIEIDNWALSDGYSGILARAFEFDQKKIKPTYIKWNVHQNPWLRRISMVGLFYYSRSRKTQPTFKMAISMIQPHLAAPEYYVQKAVGWTLRESYNVYPAETTQFIEKNIAQIHPTAWPAATEKMPLAIKKKLILQRKLKR